MFRYYKVDRAGIKSDVTERVKRLEERNKALKAANEILKDKVAILDSENATLKGNTWTGGAR